VDKVEAAVRSAWGDDDADLADVDNLRGGFEYFTGEYGKARASYLRAFERYRRTEGERSFAAVASKAQAVLMQVRQGETTQTIAELRRLLDALPDDPRLNARARAAVLRNLAQAYHAAGRPDETVRVTEQSWIALRGALGEDNPETVEALMSLATELGGLGRHADALALQETMLPKFKQRYGEVSELVILTRNNMAFNLAGLGDHAAALPLFRENLAAAAKLYGPDHPETDFATQQLAVSLMRNGAAEEALPLMRRIDEKNAGAAAPVRAHSRSNYYLAQATHSGSAVDRGRLVAYVRTLVGELGVASPITVQAAASTAELLLKQGAAEQALAMHELALRGIEAQLASEQWLPSNRRAFLSRFLEVYRTAATLHARVADDCPRALQIAESARGHTLLESVTRRRALEASDVPPDERARLIERVALRERLESAAAQAPPGSIERVQRDAEASAAAAELARLEQSLAARYPRFARLRSAQTFAFEPNRRTLAADELFVEFVVARSETIAILVGRTGPATCIGLGSSAPIVAAALALRAAIEAGPTDMRTASRGIASASATLARHLLQPIWSRAGRSARLVFSPDGPLAAIAFELLPVPGTGRPLVATHEVAYAQSLAVLAAIRTRFAAAAQGWKAELLAFGGPSYGAEAQPGGYAALVDGAQTQPTRSARSNRARAASDALDPGAAFRALGQVWSPLPGAAREALAVAALFGKSTALTGPQASEERLQQLSTTGELAGFRYLHFATHGYLSIEIPSLSAIVLSLPGTAEADGYVTAAEWPGYPLRSELVVLSGCETGLGSEGAGDGVLGLPYALFVAGNRNTVMSLWKVADESTTAFMVRFFSRLRAGEPQGAALARTKREFIDHPRFAHPLYWAGFVLYGG
jgi:tetratricopeptide (TPR) repeat protein